MELIPSEVSSDHICSFHRNLCALSTSYLFPVTFLLTSVLQIALLFFFNPFSNLTSIRFLDRFKILFPSCGHFHKTKESSTVRNLSGTFIPLLWPLSRIADRKLLLHGGHTLLRMCCLGNSVVFRVTLHYDWILVCCHTKSN